MDKSIKKKLNIDSKLEDLLIRQDEILNQILNAISIPNKKFFSKEEAAQFLNVSPKYIYQLVHQKRITPIKNKGQKKLYFLKEDLENYIMGTISGDKDFQKFEEEIEKQWKNKA